MVWNCVICHMAMSVSSRGRHLEARHKNVSTADLNNSFGPAFLTDCPFPNCNTRHLTTGLKHHWRLKHRNHPQPALAALIAPIPPADDLPEPLPLEYLDNLVELVAAVGPNVAIAINNVPPAAIPVPVAPPLPLPAPPTDRGLLVARFRYGLYRFHHTWKAPLLELFCLLLEAAQSASVVDSTKAIPALQLLPGLLEFSRRKHKNIPSPIHVLRAILACPDRVAETIRLAESWNTAFVPRPVPAYETPNKEHLRARIELLIS